MKVLIFNVTQPETGSYTLKPMAFPSATTKRPAMLLYC
jgi:hypothetical protein